MSYYLIENRQGAKTWYDQRRSPVQIIIIHTAENLPDFEGEDTGAEAISRYAATTDRNVSWHASVDSDSVVDMLPDEAVGWHCRNYNSISLGMEIATQAHRWNEVPDEWEQAVLDNVADKVADWCRAHDIPPRKLSAAEVDAGEKGLVSHSTLDPSRRSDPGIGFEWDLLIEMVEERLKGSGDGSPEPESKPKAKKKSTTTKTTSSESWEEGLLVKLGTHKRGSRGREVIKIQHLLALQNQFLKLDGIFGPRTEQAVEEFQQRARIVQDGIVGPQTWTALLTR